ncbi:tRNA lysidine(34) synthetase TilS [Ancylobacter sp. SL191]|uniref:tRNA lysidine(34) synthetase TilS n=1 Tax=Ancylobacter sp. SL191 TaxID=2995166 RepID=UPI00226E006A|nr:tRNA lysidine(34) synthetase TilS [Ancylobacter sp. SL191]WAC28935.1 tRNA lysidine(34) synthetase TilS [Ancylobacter sp. SL191]
MSAAEAGTAFDPAGLDAGTLCAGFAAHPHVLLAVSGGPDSTALMWLAARWRLESGAPTRLSVATVDHGLRPESADEAREVGRLAVGLGLTHAVLDLPSPLPGARLQEAARHARYERLAAHARDIGASAIATAHTLDDQAETVLFRLMRGSGLTGLAGMAGARALDDLVLLRPLLGCPKAALVALCRQAGLPFVEDPSNHNPRFARARLRALMPALAAEGLDAARLDRLAARLRRADAALEAATDAAAARLGVAGEGATLDRAGLCALPEEIALRLLARAIAARGEGVLELAKLEALLAWLLALPEGARGARTLAGALVRVSLRRVSITRAPARRSPPIHF